MDEKEYIKHAIADPDCKDEKFLHAKNSSDANRRILEQQRQADTDIRNAMQVDVPEGLEGRILLNQSLKEKKQKSQWLKNIYTIAASLLMVAVILIQVLPGTQSIETVVLAHIHDELDHLQDQRNVSSDALNRLIGTFGGHFEISPGQVNYAGLCNIRNGQGMHIVLESEQGPVTVLIMPEESIDKRLTVSDKRFNGVILPVENGSLAVVAEDAKAVTMVESRIQNIISWNG
ncbi:MAG: DUF3379 family protein [Gammaproteobacteria bacterium]|nr:MAG: DUF3379 family protein [Gammaproteobacteria bacterium]